jgi:peptidoglycan/LPS O-acetylase OafA/YrhL
MFVIVPFLHPSEVQTLFGARSSPWWSFLLFLQNFIVPIPTNATRLLGVTWSLAVEEQFYLAWPLVVRFISEAQLRKIALGGICISPAPRLYLVAAQSQYLHEHILPSGWLDGWALLALIVRSSSSVPSRFVTGAWITLFVSASLALVIDTPHLRWIVFSFVALASASFVYLALFSKQGLLQALLTNRFLAYTGTISYGIYLLEKIPLDVFKVSHLEKYAFLAFLIAIAATYSMAILSWNLLEKPFIRLKRFSSMERQLPKIPRRMGS